MEMQVTTGAVRRAKLQPVVFLAVQNIFVYLGEGIDPCQRSDDNSANTALHVAARAGHHQIVLYLLQVNFFVGVIVAGPHGMHAGISHAHMNLIGCDQRWETTRNFGFIFDLGSLIIRVWFYSGSEYFKKNCVRFKFCKHKVRVLCRWNCKDVSLVVICYGLTVSVIVSTSYLTEDKCPKIVFIIIRLVVELGQPK